jgi:cyclic pyranopterin phosphate synthase
MPRTTFGPDHAFAPRSELLSYEELTRVARAFADLGVSKIRLTGGEPLLRRDLETLIGMVAAIPGIDDVAMTTNGSLLAGRAAGLRDAGLSRVTVSLDTIDPEVFASMADSRVELAAVLAGIAAAQRTGLGPVKLNAVVQRGVNDGGLLDLADYARAEGVTLRFIEYMDVGSSNGWLHDQVVPAAEIIDRIAAVHPLESVAPAARGEVARRWRYVDGAGEIGVISSVTAPFCGDCTRARVTATGELFTCLFAQSGRDLRSLLRSGATHEELVTVLSSTWSDRSDRYSELRHLETPGLQKPEMSYLGG